MLSAKKVLAASMDYTDESVAGAGAIKGAPCEIKSISPITGGNTVTFKWLDSNNVEHTSTMDVMDGEDGKGIASVTINAEEHLIITYTDGSTSDAGKIEVQSAVDSVNGQTGEVVLTASDVNALPDDTTLADLSGDSTHRTVTDAEKTAWNAKSDFSGSYDDLTDKPSIPDEISDLDDTAISSPTNGQVMTYDSGKWKNADNNPTITVDSALSTTSENPVQNKVLTTEINKKAEYEEISWEDYQALSYEEKHNGKQYFVTGAPASAVSASGVSYDNATSGMTADNVQDALDEIAAGGGQITVDSAMSTTSTNPLQNKVITLEVQDMRASMLNDELKLSAVELAVSQLQTSALNTELRLSTAELAVSQLQTSMLNMDGAVDDIEDEIADIVNVYGSKNLMKATALSHTQNGITKTVNADGSFTLNGTATDNTYFYWMGPTTFPTENIQYTYSIETSAVWGVGQSSAIAGIDKRSETAYIGRYKSIFADGTTHMEGTFTGESGYYAWAWIFIPKGTQLTDVIVKGMIRLASISDDTYAPYVPTNAKLNEEKMSYADNGVLGAKNLLQNTATTQTINNVAFTVNSDDKTVKVTRTAEQTEIATRDLYVVSDEDYKLLAGKTLLMTGCPSGGSNDTYYLECYYNDGTGHWLRDIGNGLTITLPATKPTTIKFLIGIKVASVIPSGGLTFKPMLRLASDSDDTYQPYAMTNRELTDVVPSDASASNKLATIDKTTVAYQKTQTIASNGDWQEACQIFNVPVGTYLATVYRSTDVSANLQTPDLPSIAFNWADGSRSQSVVVTIATAGKVDIAVKGVSGNSYDFKLVLEKVSDAHTTASYKAVGLGMTTSSVTSGSTAPITSGGVYNAVPIMQYNFDNGKSIVLSMNSTQYRKVCIYNETEYYEFVVHEWGANPQYHWIVGTTLPSRITASYSGYRLTLSSTATYRIIIEAPDGRDAIASYT